jgi:probable F420-dependent oxidoreductase
MTFGIGMFPTEYAMEPAQLGRECEERGFDSLYFPEHTHIPTSRQSPYPGGGELPREYTHTLDPFVALTAVAAATSKLRLGFGVCLVTERDPIATAGAVATLDLLSGGRVDFGVGAGWNLEEMANHGTDPARRFRLQRERVEAMKAIWTQEEAEYHGELVDFDPLWQWPKPSQKPHPPVLIGNNGPKAVDRVLRYGDGWLPLGLRGLGDLAGLIGELQSRAADAGRGRLPVILFGIEETEAEIEKAVQAGVDSVLFLIPSVDGDEILRQLDARAELAAKFG